MRSTRSVALAGVGALLLSACVDGGDPMGSVAAAPLGIYAQPAFAVTVSEAELALLDAARIVVFAASDSSVVAEVEGPIDPREPTWVFQVSTEVRTDEVVTFYVETLLLDTDPPVASVEWSGRTEPFDVSASYLTAEVRLVSLYRGPVANLDLTGVTVDRPVLNLLEDGSATIQLTVEGATPETKLYFASTNPPVADVDTAGVIHAKSAGETQIIVHGGTVADTIGLTVRQVVIPPPVELDEELLPQFEYITSDLFIGTLQDTQGAEAIRTAVVLLGSTLTSGDGPGTVHAFEAAVAAWRAYGPDAATRYADGAQLTVVELVLLLVADMLNTDLP